MPCDQNAASARRERVGPARRVDAEDEDEEEAGADFSDAADFSDVEDFSEFADVADFSDMTGFDEEEADDAVADETEAGGVEAGSKPRGMRRNCRAIRKWPGVRSPCAKDFSSDMESALPELMESALVSGRDRRRRMTSSIRIW